MTLSLLLFAQLDQSSNFWDMLPGLLTGGFGMALTMTPTTAAAMGSVPVDKAGVGSAVLNAFRQVGGSLGIAIMGAVVASQISVGPQSPAYRRSVRRRLPPRPLRRRGDRVHRRARRCRDDPEGPARRARRGGRRGMSAVPARSRLPAVERRAAVLDAALRVFGEGSYGGATTAEIARAAGVSEPILYRHFGSKRDLYCACLDEMWRRLRETVEQVVADEPDPREWLFAVPKAIGLLRAKSVHPNQLWIQALSQAGEDPELRRYVRKHMREVHDFVADLYPTGAGRRRHRPGTRRLGGSLDRPRHRPPPVGAGQPRRPPDAGRLHGDPDRPQTVPGRLRLRARAPVSAAKPGLGPGVAQAALGAAAKGKGARGGTRLFPP